MVMFLVYSGSARTKSSGMSCETGVVHCTSGCFSSSSTRQATAAAVVDLEMLARLKIVSSVAFSSLATSARP